ncbi:MAG: hypothetical protein HQ567_05020 [Candidatus Nealsonbacteria bacterium]|nr:hypothetical protein [Candidatus Nealsonbacteria bacterium]
MNAHRTLSLGAALCLCLWLVLLATGNAFAVVGEIAIYQELGGADAIAQGTTFTHEWDDTVRDAGTYSLSGSNITLADAGHYLVMYNSRFDMTDGGNRSEFNSGLYLDDSPMP